MGDFYDRLKEARDEVGWTQTDAGDAVGATRKTVGSWENGGDPPITYLLALANKGINMEWLFSNAGGKRRSEGDRARAREAEAFGEIAAIVLRVARTVDSRFGGASGDALDDLAGDG